MCFSLMIQWCVFLLFYKFVNNLFFISLSVSGSEYRLSDDSVTELNHSETQAGHCELHERAKVNKTNKKHLETPKLKC